jgi:hypothetical protein
LIVLHDPNGGEIAIDTRQIVLIRPVEGIREHLAVGTETIVYLAGQKIGVRELPHEVEYLTKICEDGER